MQEILTEPRMIMAIATVIAVVVGYFLKRGLEAAKIRPFVALIISLIFKTESNVEGQGLGEIKKKRVVGELEKELSANDKSIINRVLGSIPNAVEFTFKKFAGKAIKRGWNKIF